MLDLRISHPTKSPTEIFPQQVRLALLFDDFYRAKTGQHVSITDALDGCVIEEEIEERGVVVLSESSHTSLTSTYIPRSTLVETAMQCAIQGRRQHILRAINSTFSDKMWKSEVPYKSALELLIAQNGTNVKYRPLHKNT